MKEPFLCFHGLFRCVGQVQLRSWIKNGGARPCKIFFMRYFSSHACSGNDGMWGRNQTMIILTKPDRGRSSGIRNRAPKLMVKA